MQVTWVGVGWVQKPGWRGVRVEVLKKAPIRKKKIIVIEKTAAPQTARSNQSVLKENPEYSLEGLMLKLKLQYFGLLM